MQNDDVNFTNMLAMVVDFVHLTPERFGRISITVFNYRI